MLKPPHESTVMMEHCRSDHNDDRAVDRDDTYCIHFDLKPGNIFSCHETTTYNYGGGQTVTYPDIQIGDFGTAEYVFPESAMNPFFFDGGTNGYWPPVSTPSHGILSLESSLSIGA